LRARAAESRGEIPASRRSVWIDTHAHTCLPSLASSATNSREGGEGRNPGIPNSIFGTTVLGEWGRPAGRRRMKASSCSSEIGKRLGLRKKEKGRRKERKAKADCVSDRWQAALSRKANYYVCARDCLTCERARCALLRSAPCEREHYVRYVGCWTCDRWCRLDDSGSNCCSSTRERYGG